MLIKATVVREGVSFSEEIVDTEKVCINGVVVAIGSWAETKPDPLVEQLRREAIAHENAKRARENPDHRLMRERQELERARDEGRERE